MNILLCAATVTEITPFLKNLRRSDFVPGTIDVLITGIGLTAATYSITKQISIKKPELIIQAGVAGCFNKKIHLGTVVTVSQETVADQGVIETNRFKTIFDLKLVQKNKYPFSKGWLINKNSILKKSHLRSVKGISVNEITTSLQKIKFYKQVFNPVIESMEGAALHYVCLMEKIPFIQLRSISNYVGERNKEKWNMKESVINLNRELFNLLENI